MGKFKYTYYPNFLMKIERKYLGKILNSRRFYSKIREIGSISFETNRESSFLVTQKIGEDEFTISNIRKGTYNMALDTLNLDEDDGTNSFSSVGMKLSNYTLLGVHTHDGQYGPIVPSLSFETADGDPIGDLVALKNDRVHFRQESGYDIKPLMGIIKARNPTQLDLLLFQEKNCKPSEIGELLDVENALQNHHESEWYNSPEESYEASQQVAEALRGTGYYHAELIRYRHGRAVKEDLDKLITFEFEERKLSSKIPNSHGTP